MEKERKKNNGENQWWKKDNSENQIDMFHSEDNPVL